MPTQADGTSFQNVQIVGGATNSPPLNPDGTPYGSDNAVVASVAASTSGVSLRPANPARKGMTFTNESTAACRIKFGSGISTTSYTRKMAPGEYYETPYNFKGQVGGIWEAADGNMRITEFS